MKKILLIITVIALFSCQKRNTTVIKTTENKRESVEFVYNKMYFSGDSFIIKGYILNNTSESRSFNTFYIRIFDKYTNETCYEDTLSFPEGYFLEAFHLEKVTITFPKEESNTSAFNYSIYYEYT